jgi:hypothetical protein
MANLNQHYTDKPKTPETEKMGKDCRLHSYILSPNWVSAIHVLSEFRACPFLVTADLLIFDRNWVGLNQRRNHP